MFYQCLQRLCSLLNDFLNFNFFELPLRLGRQARFLYVENADAFSTIQKNRKLASSRQLLGFYF